MLMKCVSYALTLTGGCADDRILQAEKAVKRAEAQQERAGKAQEWCLAKLESAQARLEPALDDPECMSDARFSQLSKADSGRGHGAMHSRAACRAGGDAEIGVLRTQLEESEADNALLLLQRGHTARELDTAVKLADKCYGERA